MKVAIILFENFETLDVFGPVEIIGRLPQYFEMEYYSFRGGTISSTQGVKINTKKLDSTTILSDILVIPGGIGTRTEIENQAFIDLLQQVAASSQYVLTVCTGSALLAKTGWLDHKKATSNKRAWSWVTSVNQQVKWQKKARWTVDGKYYTSSGISAGMDMTLGFVADLLGEAKANQIALEMEYEWNNNPENDNFAYIYPHEK